MRYLFVLSILFTTYVYGQDAPNAANATSGVGNAAAEAKFGAVPVNFYTGMPNVSVPIYNYGSAGSGLSWPVSLEYFSGGIRVGESPGSVGLGWNFNATGAITRTVRGMPDDLPTNGFLYSSAVIADVNTYGNQYATDSMDAQQDVFQFNFKGRSGQFLIGKNKQIVQIPNTKINISYQVSSVDNSSIVSFRVVTEDGTIYDFATEETTKLTGSNFTFGYSGKSYGSSWWLTDVIAPFGTDTIRFNYTSTTINAGQSSAQVTYHDDANHLPLWHTSDASATIQSWQLSSIAFPAQKSLQVVYSLQYGNEISKIKICDSIFRFGFALDYQPTDGGKGNLLLSKVTPYTSRQEQEGYSFLYNSGFAPNPPAGSNYAYQQDYWGYYNGVTTNQSLIPKEGNPNDANRSPNIFYATYNTLSQYYKPGEGYVQYQYELNDRYPLLKTANAITVSGSAGSTSSTVSFAQVFGTKQQLTLTLDPSVARNVSLPITGGGTIFLTIKSTDGSVQYASTAYSLYDLFYLGSLTWQFNIPNGTYQLATSLLAGTSVSGSFPINISWESRVTDNSKNATVSGGLRVKRITRGDAVDDNFLYEDFQYLTEDGKSSGILGDTAAFSYPYTEVVTGAPPVQTTYKMINSDPTNSQDYSQGTSVGYSRIIVYKGTTTHNLGKAVYEFTGPADVNCNLSTRVFPYTPQDLRSWGMGLPKRTSIFDSSGRLVKRTVNSYRFDTVAYNTWDFTSQQLGTNWSLVNGLTKYPTYIAQQYFPSSGQYYVTSTTDTLYQADGSFNASYRNYQYDSNYNVTKVITGYDRTRGLQLETRYYYPYNYVVGGVLAALRANSILSPVIATEYWITGDGNPRIIGGGITELQQLPSGYIKPLRTYALQTAATIPQSTIGLFDSSKLNRSTTWFVAQDSFPTYSAKGNLLQATNATNGLSSAVIRDYSDQYAVATVSNASYGDVAYTSFESDGSGNWTIGSTLRDYSGALTGKKAYNIANGNVSRSGLNSGKSYLVSLWARSPASVQINGISQYSPIATQNGWSLYLTTVSGSISVTVSGSGVIDELRLYPKDANMATTAYEPLVGPTATCDANNTVVYTSYDLLNRPKLIRDKDLNIIKRFDYADSDFLINTDPLWSRSARFQWDPNITCGFDSVITVVDRNPWSDTYSYTTITPVFHGYNFCSCSLSANYPAWKIVDSVCTQAIKQYTSCIYKSEFGGYQCFWHYVWPDCTTSDSQYEINPSPVTVTSGCPPPGAFP